jgi:hypothetical protein
MKLEPVEGPLPEWDHLAGELFLDEDGVRRAVEAALRGAVGDTLDWVRLDAAILRADLDGPQPIDARALETSAGIRIVRWQATSIPDIATIQSTIMPNTALLQRRDRPYEREGDPNLPGRPILSCPHQRTAQDHHPHLSLSRTALRRDSTVFSSQVRGARASASPRTGQTPPNGQDAATRRVERASL